MPAFLLFPLPLGFEIFLFNDNPADDRAMHGETMLPAGLPINDSH